jgi:tricorn protease
MLAFSAEYDGNMDVYTVAAAGGVPRRLTYHPGTDIVTGWTSDGQRVLFASSRISENGRFSRLFDGGERRFPEALPLPMGNEAAMSPDGAPSHVPIPRAFNNWKRYRGGQATPL